MIKIPFLRLLLTVWLGMLMNTARAELAFNTQLRSYNTFDVAQMGHGKEVTVGRYVLASIPLHGSVQLRATHTPQRLHVRLEWPHRSDRTLPVELTSQWHSQEQRLVISLHPRRSWQPKRWPQARKHPPTPVVVITNPMRSAVSLPLGTHRPIYLEAETKELERLDPDLRLLVSSNAAYQINRRIF